MPKLLLTDRYVDTIKPAEKAVEIYDSVSRDLALRVWPSGRKTWTLRYRPAAGGKQRRISFGAYPDVTLKDARLHADSARGRVADNEDPAVEKQAARTTAIETDTAKDTMADLAKEYLARYAKVHKRSWREDQRMIDAEILPRWKRKKVRDLTRRDVRALVNDVADRAPIAGNRYLALVSGMLKYGVKNDWIDSNVASHISKPGREVQRERVMTDDEIRLWWRGSATERPMLCALTRLRFLTLQRGKELAHIKWADIDGAWLTLRPDLTKNKKPHRVYLTAEARAILDELPQFEDCPFVFPGETLRRPLGDYQKVGPHIRAWVERERAEEGDTTSPPFDVNPHDMRRTGATRLAEAGIPHADISKVLNHAEGGPKATHIYVRYQFDKEKQIALETWGRLLAGIIKNKPAGKSVVPFARA